MKSRKIPALIMSIGLSATAIFGSFGTVNAENSAQKLYTLSELNAMSKEDFLALEMEGYVSDDFSPTTDVPLSGKECLSAVEFYSGLTFSSEYISNVYDSKQIPTGIIGLYGTWDPKKSQDSSYGVIEKYTPNVTEKKLVELLGNDVCNILSPVSGDYTIDLAHDAVYPNRFSIIFSDYKCLTIFDDLISDSVKATEDTALSFAKMWYCVNQVVPLGVKINLPGDTSVYSEDKIIAGDVTYDRNIDIYDVIWIASDLSGIFELTDAQKTVGDVNDDGECDLYDAIDIAKGLM